MKIKTLLLAILAISLFMSCKKDDNKDDKTHVILASAKIDGKEFKPTSCDLSSNIDDGVTIVLKDANQTVIMETSGSSVGIYTISGNKGTNENTATAIIVKDNVRYNATSGNVEIKFNEGNKLTGIGDFSAANESQTINVSEVKFTNIAISSLADLIKGTYTGIRTISVKVPYTYKDSLGVEHESEKYVSKDISSKVIINNSNSDLVNLSLTANKNEFNAINYKELSLKKEFVHKTDSLPSGVIVPRTYEFIHLYESKEYTDSIGNVKKYKSHRGHVNDNRLSIDDFNGVKQ